MHQVSHSKLENKNPIQNAIISTLAFFSLLKIPLERERLFAFLYKTQATRQQVNNELSVLIEAGVVIEKNRLIGVFDWDNNEFAIAVAEAKKKWKKIHRYFWVLSLIPYIKHVSIINSLALGNANLESDIDFFVVTKPNRLYFVRSLIIIVFKILGVYKSKHKIKDKFCFGFYVTSNKSDLSRVLIKPEDPLFAFWFASFNPILGSQEYLGFAGQNEWINKYFPNFNAENNLSTIIKPNRVATIAKKLAEVVFWPLAAALEPLARQVHISHTFKLPENHWATAKTVADKDMLKLHALDPREEFQAKFSQLLKDLKI